jgi:ComF family protein
MSRVPVCRTCLTDSRSFTPEFHCARCRTPFANHHPLDSEGVCRLCRGGGNRFDAAYTYGAYEGTLRRLIHLLKYEGVASVAAPLGKHLSEALPREQRFDCIAAVPMHWTRRFRRGFNHAELLAEELARRTGVPAKNLLRRKRNTAPQAQLTGAARRRNLSGSIGLGNSDVRDLRILLIDDVFTTGATANACASVLKRAGAAHVSVLTLARADRPFSETFQPVENQPIANDQAVAAVSQSARKGA